MTHPRLTLAADQGALEFSADGPIAIFAPRQGMDLSDLPFGRCRIIQPMRPDFEAFERAGYTCALAEDGAYDAALVCLPRAKAQAKDLIARAAACADRVIVDGQKTEGADSLLKECRKRADVLGVVSKAHGKLFWFEGGDFADWLAPKAKEIEDGFATRAGVFSADGIDPASRVLAAALPEKLGRNVADLGAGWGYLSRDILQRPDVETLYLIEADHVALECAKQNVIDPRAEFHWADATTWVARARMDTVVMNPPFHTSRSADPALGVGFIGAAARMLAPSGQLWMVANRHLPYEAALDGLFGQVQEVGGDNRFKILHAQRPSRARR